MANQTGIGMVLEKLNQQIGVFQQTLKLLLDREQSQRKRSSSGKAEPVYVYTGPALEIGNELLITGDIIKMYQGLSNALGRVVIVDHISIGEAEPIKASAFGIQISVAMIVAQQMREAYLRREQAWT